MSHTVESLDELAALYGEPLATSVNKESPVINAAYRKLLEAAPFVAVASSGPGGLDCSPRGDGPGFVQIADERTLLLPDRRGNNRLDTLRNLVQDPRVALLFLIPGIHLSLRVNGHATLSTDPALLARFEVNEKTPTTVMVVAVDTLYFQCARALKRAQLWSASSQRDPAELPSAGQLAQSAMPDFDADG
ncbi:MAG: MSMEG_1061 family FMN-dependent PPOX-type flavoprotein, partial [Pseudomonadota bacterium]